MNPKKHLSFGSLSDFMSRHLNEYPDWRHANKTMYSVSDGVMSAFACMYFQSPSLLQFQQELERREKDNNVRTLFGVSAIPETTQIRDITDNVNSEYFRSIFKEFLLRLQRGKHLEQYQFIDGKYLCDIDGTQFFSSSKIHCSKCLTTKHRDGSITYSHKVLQAAIVHPNVRQVIPLAPEQIVNADGNAKQDCEINASKRWLIKMKKDHPRLPLIINADGLTSKQPFIEAVKRVGYSYILVAKPADHKYLMDWVDAFDVIPTKRVVDNKGRTHEYQWESDVPLNGGENSERVNFFRHKITSTKANGDTKIHYKNSWVTNLDLNEENIELMVKGARSRWKIENECFNTLKNQGYQMEHNYGHGAKNLSFNLYLLILLAFYFHQVFELTDKLYQSCRQTHSSKRHMWERLRSYIDIIVFDSWEFLLNFAIAPARYCQPLKNPRDG